MFLKFGIKGGEWWSCLIHAASLTIPAFVSNLSALMAVPGLIERLPTDAEMATSPCHAFAFEAPLREELPEGFLRRAPRNPL